jgi:aldehyde dehydrogenase (NAD+)
MNVREHTHEILTRLGVDAASLDGGDLAVTTPVNGEVVARLAQDDADSAAATIERANRAFHHWREVPPPQRGELVRLLGDELRQAKADLGRIVSVEAGKIRAEGEGEVQEMIDICDFALGQSRQLYGRTMASERPGHRMMETWHPLGVLGVITSFNFPVAPWSWNSAVALVAGDPVVWKPSEKTPLTALACQALFRRAAARFGEAPEDLLSVLIGGPEVANAVVDHPQVPVVSATGSTQMGREVGPRLARRFARPILELGGNNAAIVCPSADLALARQAIAFGAMGTAGQRCTTQRRLIVHEDVYEDLMPGLRRAYETVTIGNPLTTDALVGPLINARAYEAMQAALERARADGGRVTGGELVDVGEPNAWYVRPALVEMPAQTEVVTEETFAPILYAMTYRDLDSALAMHNAVGGGLSASIFTRDVREAERFMGPSGSDCGITNVNIGTSGAEIGGAFGGEKETGGGRESGSDVWKAYMRRATNTINYSDELPLAQGVSFEIE